VASGLVLESAAASAPDLASGRVAVLGSAQVLVLAPVVVVVLVLVPVVGLVQVSELAPAWGQASVRDQPGAGSQSRAHQQS
jgi:hypothetical protein